MQTQDEVLFDEMKGSDGYLGLITLNRPRALNSLTHTMIIAMHGQLQQWANDTKIKAVVIKAVEGRAFCAGGDLRLTHHRFHQNDPALKEFFRDEYQLNRFIFHFPKPYIALLDGITMGGGVGISLHGSHRVGTDHLLFAMPETGIGFFPDVGGTYFLPRLPGMIGFYLGLTGARINSDDCVAIGLTQEKVAREMLPSLIQTLAEHPFAKDAKATVSEIIARFKIHHGPSKLLENQKVIDTCFKPTSMEEIVRLLNHSDNAICKEAVSALNTKSPTSLKVTLKALHEGQHLDFDACMQQEYRLTSHFLEGGDFIEGIRAVIIDKDQTPHWHPSSLEGVTHHEVNKYFAPLSKELV